MKVYAIFLTLLLFFSLLAGVTEFPTFGDPASPAHGDLYAAYTELTTVKTGAVNQVAGIILDFRALDTLLEAAVIFTAGLLVFHLLREGE